MSGVALVTGGASGIGAEICRQMLAAGYEVISLSLRVPDWTHERLHAEVVDLLDASATRAVAHRVASSFAITHVVHNAGAIRPALLDDVTDADLAALTQLHLGAALQIVQACVGGMRARKFGRIVMISSRGALGLATRSAYAATKAGVIGLARTWAVELAGEGITVNVVSPGPIADTDMFRNVVPEGSPREANLAAAIPVQRLGRSEDVARAVMFFADPANSFVTGQNLYVCGGASLGAIVI
jgi:NAD(P)-dependent dehydrogenase (short-subunit alcohol dehydrogenase family)